MLSLMIYGEYPTTTTTTAAVFLHFSYTAVRVRLLYGSSTRVIAALLLLMNAFYDDSSSSKTPLDV